MTTRHRSTSGVLALVIALGVAMPGSAQLTGLENGEWRYLIGDAGATRSNPQLTQINASNFEDLGGDLESGGATTPGPQPAYTSRAVPIYVDGMLYTVSGARRQVVAIDPASGETVWMFREPNTTRYMRSPRAAHGKGVAYGEIDGRGVIYITTPAFFLWALDAKTGLPLDNWGSPVPLDDFAQTGVVDLIPDLIRGLGAVAGLRGRGGDLRPGLWGFPGSWGMVTSSSPPIVVNDVIVAQTAHEPAYSQRQDRERPGRPLGLRRQDRRAALEVPRHPAAR